MKNKEYGSDFHYIAEAVNDTEQSIFSIQGIPHYFLSGRAALYNLLHFGISRYKWKKVGFPSYYCHEVVDFCRSLPIEIEYYTYNPFVHNEIEWQDDEAHVLISVDYFGIQKPDTILFKKTVLIDDATHHLLSIQHSNADYCIASLRKQLPLPVGGVCISKRNDFITAVQQNEFANIIAAKKFTAMFLKAMYLKNEFKSKDVFRAMFIDAEEMIKSPESNAKIPEIALGQLLSFPAKSNITETYANVTFAKQQLSLPPSIQLLNGKANTAMGLVLVCKSVDVRNALKSHLVENSIYPAVLWPGQSLPEDVDLQNKILFIHMDFRYQKEDITFICSTVNNFIA